VGRPPQRPVEPGSVITVGDEKSASLPVTPKLIAVVLDYVQSWWRWFKSTGGETTGEIVDVPF